MSLLNKIQTITGYSVYFIIISSLNFTSKLPLDLSLSANTLSCHCKGQIHPRCQ